MANKFQSKKKEAEPVVDEWDAEDSGGEVDESEAAQQSNGQSVAQSIGKQSSKGNDDARVDAWGEEVEMPKRNAASVDQPNGRTLWQEANRAAPLPQPVLETNRSLPSTVMNPRLYTSTGGTHDHQQAAAPPPPQILRREKVAFGQGGSANDKGNEKKKTMQEREEEYRKARERIFGASSTSSSPDTSQPSSRSGTPNHSSSSQQRKGSKGKS